jgi:hypothetical protein
MNANIENTIKDWFIAWNSHDARRVSQFYTDDAILEDLPHRIICHGTIEILKAVDIFFIGIHDIKIELKTNIISGLFVCNECIYSGMQIVVNNSSDRSVSEKRFSVPMVYVSEWQDSKIKRHTVYHDQLSIMQQLGLIPTMPLK